MTELEQNVAKLEATQKEIQEKTMALDKVKADTADYESKSAALKAELDRVNSDIARAKDERRQKDSTFQDRLRTENLEVAKTKFFAEHKYEPAEQAKLLEEFKKHDSGSVNPDLILNDFRRTHVALNTEKYLKLEEDMNRLRSNSEEFNRLASSTGFSGASMGVKTEDNGLSKEDIQAAGWAGIPLERYKKLKAEGKVD